MREDTPPEEHSTNMEKFTDLLHDIKIDGKIDNLLRHLDHLNKELPGENNTNTQLQHIAYKIDSGEIDKTYVSDQYFHMNFKDKDPKTKLTKSLLLAHIYTSTAIELKKHNNLMMAWNAISEANKYIGTCNAIYEALANPKIKRASKGGKANAKKVSDFKESVIEALHSFRPKKGWSSSSMATDQIIDHLIKSSSQRKDNHPEDRSDLIAKVRNMIEDDKDVQMAFTAATRQEQKHPSL
ncbi:hypothetical protein PS870_03862 [Pseudomonas fluorescens]|uniref:Uncharacterized protein n=2 Tax=Pseudomonas fluorescens TaxID=294 RepID=A0A5E7MAZ8_PSEFL|nr:hypothetical protein PS870_03862 [Pseudomonas fluorescens]